MPCYDGHREDERQDRETAKKVEAVLCGVINAFGLGRVLDHVLFGECGVSREWLVDWWREHQRKDADRKEYEAAREAAARVRGGPPRPSS